MSCFLSLLEIMLLLFSVDFLHGTKGEMITGFGIELFTKPDTAVCAPPDFA